MELAYINLNHPDCASFCRSNESVGLQQTSANFSSVQQLHEPPRRIDPVQPDTNMPNPPSRSILDHLPFMPSEEVSTARVATAAKFASERPLLPKVCYGAIDMNDLQKI